MPKETSQEPNARVALVEEHVRREKRQVEGCASLCAPCTRSREIDWPASGSTTTAPACSGRSVSSTIPTPRRVALLTALTHPVTIAKAYARAARSRAAGKAR
jgi:hypothetical protein